MNRKITKASVRIALTCAIAMASSGAALAHAALQHASPGAGSTVSESPHEVTLTFTDALEAAFSSADVTDSSGVRVDEGKPQVNGNMIRIALKTLSPGSYRIHWRAVSVDTHWSEGSFTFSVRSVKPTVPKWAAMSAFGGKADIAVTLRNVPLLTQSGRSRVPRMHLLAKRYALCLSLLNALAGRATFY